jgi:hypothetical protein
MLRGRTVPRQWGTAATALCELCELAGIDPADYADGVGGFRSENTHLSAFKQLWHNAADAPRPLSNAEIDAAKIRDERAIAKLIRQSRLAQSRLRRPAFAGNRGRARATCLAMNSSPLGDLVLLSIEMTCQTCLLD